MDFLIEKGYKFDAIITDPPYAITNLEWDKIIPFKEMWSRLEKLIKDDGAIVLFGNEPFSSNLRVSNQKMYKYDWKWVKNQVTGFQNAKYQPLRCYEDIMVFSKGGVSTHSDVPMKYYPQGVIPVNVKMIKTKINYLREKKETDKKQKEEYTRDSMNLPRNVVKFPRESILYHPTQKPINLMEYLVLTYTKKNELVLDFTSGSGSTLLTCELLNRKWVGIELTEKYCKVIKERISTGIQLKMQFDFNDSNEEE